MTVLKPNGLLNSKIPWRNEIALQVQVKHIDIEQVQNWLCCYTCWRGILNSM